MAKAPAVKWPDMLAAKSTLHCRTDFTTTSISPSTDSMILMGTSDLIHNNNNMTAFSPSRMSNKTSFERQLIIGASLYC